MAKLVQFYGNETSLQSHRDAMRFYPTLISKIKPRSYKDSAVYLDNLSADALEVFVGWINRHQHDEGRDVINYSEDPVAVILTEDDEKILKSVDRNVILEIVQVADEHDMMDLLDGACQIAAPIVEDMSPVELKAKFFNPIKEQDFLGNKEEKPKDYEEEGFLGDDDEL